jgi:GNAT superfamily N-acetyltransferase
VTELLEANNAAVISRTLRAEDDFWRIRGLLIDTVPLIPIGFNWDMRRLDGKRFYEANVEQNWPPTQPIQLWETGNGRLAGFVLADGGGNAHLNVHPDYRHLEGEMIDWAIAHLAESTPEGRRLELYVYEYDVLRHRLLAERGFIKTGDWGMIRHLRLGQRPLAQASVTEGYTARATRPDDLADCQRMADLLNAAFRRDFHNAAEYHNFCRLAPCFHPELDLVAVAPDGSFAAYVGVPYDEANRRGIFEPVCTHPDHQRKGLAGALMQEALLRLRVIGAVDATVDTGDMVPANRFYDSMGFTEAYRGYGWQRLQPT